MLQTIVNAWKIADLRKKLLFTALIVLIFRIGSAIPVPFTNIGENGILIEEKDNLQIINPDYIVRIREYPKNKKGKKKSVILD